MWPNSTSQVHPKSLKLVHTRTTVFWKLKGEKAGMKLMEPLPVVLFTDNM